MDRYLPSFEWHHTTEGETFLQQLSNGRTPGRKLFGVLEKPFQSSDLEEVCYKLIFLGKTAVGKTSIVNKLAGISPNLAYFETPGVNITDVYWPVKVMDKIILFKLQCWDAGNNCMKKYNHIPLQENKEALSSEESDNKSGSGSTSGATGENTALLNDRIQYLNKGLTALGSSPITKKKLTHKRYSEKKVKKITEVIKKKVFNVTDDGPDDLDDNDDDITILRNLQESFNTLQDRVHKIKILTICRHWSYNKILINFPTATRHMISVAKTIAKEKGILSDPNPKYHLSLEADVVSTIVTFYQSDDYTQLIPGQKDYVSLKVGETRIHMQKRLILNNLKELYDHFKIKHPTIKCSFSKFASLRPKHCVLAGASGTHSVCVCAIHENVKLLIDGANLKSITADLTQPIKNYHDCLDRMICPNKSTNCCLGECDKCPGITNIINQLEQTFQDKIIENITYRQWITTERTTLQTLISSVDEFLQNISNGLSKLLTHSFLVNKQRDFLNDKKIKLLKNECIVICDFSENYSFIIQNSVQGFHWDNDQVTINPFSISYKDDKNELQLKSLVSMSDCLRHDTIALHIFQKQLVQFIKLNLKGVNKIIYFSDGASGQYKNKKNLINLSHHEKDFKLSAEWHFFPTSHGKGPCDGLGGTLKRLAARTSLQRVNNPIRTPKELFDWATEALPNITCCYSTVNEYKLEEKQLSERFQKALTIKGTLKYHCINPISLQQLEAKRFSSCEKKDIVKIF